jgi:hypothetical protein
MIRELFVVNNLFSKNEKSSYEFRNYLRKYEYGK